MKQILAILFFSFLTKTVLTQDLTGVWRGSFYNVREVLMGGSRYRYEVQIDNKGKGVKGVTYSYQTTRFYGKASLIGIWTPSTQNLVMKEEKMEELKIEGGGEGCLMTCYLDYRKEGDKEYLEGTYTSRNMNNGTDCGGGKVFLERVPDSDFEKEDFIKKKENKQNGKVKPGQEDFLIKKPDTGKVSPSTQSKPLAKKTPVKKPTSPSIAKATPKKPTTPGTKKPGPPVAQQTSPAKKPVAGSGNTAKAPSVKKPDSTLGKIGVPGKVIPPVASAPVKVAPPPVLKQRKNELFQTITTSARQISVSFYDNGDIDGDTISVYDNNRLLVKSKGLTAKPITITINLNENDSEHEIVMVAENLGSIPPNTALMIVQAGSQRYTVWLSSSEQKNAMVRFSYEPD